MNPPDVLDRLLFHADRVEECGHLNAARYMRLAADEIERLRAALESLTEDPPATLDEPDEDCEVIVKMRAIARAALPSQERNTP